MRIAIMQPYFMPYIGYFQLIQAVDTFVLYDNIKYTKKGWINRNRYLHNKSDATFTIPLKKDSDFLNVDQRSVSPDFNRQKLLNQVRGEYAKSPYFKDAFSLFQEAINCPDANLFRYVKNALTIVCRYIGIRTPIVDSSTVEIDHDLQGQCKVLAICETLKASTYINAIGGVALYSNEDFNNRGIELCFIQSEYREYDQFCKPFVPWLSILDLLMFNSPEEIMDYVSNGFSIVSGRESST